MKDIESQPVPTFVLAHCAHSDGAHTGWSASRRAWGWEGEMTRAMESTLVILSEEREKRKLEALWDGQKSR